MNKTLYGTLTVACLMASFAAQAQSIRVTPVTTANFGTIPVGSSTTLSFDVDDSTYMGLGTLPRLRTLVQSFDPGDMFGNTPTSDFTLNMGTCVAGVGVTGTPLTMGAGCRFTVTFAPATPGASSTFIIATNEPYGRWDNHIQLTGTAIAAAAAPASIPTLSQWGMIALTSVLGMFGVAALRRRQRLGR